MAFKKKPGELANISYAPPASGWMDTPAAMTPGFWLYPGKPKNIEALGMPNPHVWSPTEEDWNLPENWQEIILKGLRERLDKYRSLKLWMDTCVRCGACADKCHFYIGTGDPKNMPVLRAELLRSVYRNDFTTFGKLLGKWAGARPLTPAVIKEWFYYFFQCTQCRRCSLYCPFGIDTAEITLLGRELLNELGISIDWIVASAANCFKTGNHLGIQPQAFPDMVEYFADEIKNITGVQINPTFNRKGAEVLFITPSGDFMAEPGTFTLMGYMMLFHEIGLDYTFSTYASDGGNFGMFNSHETMKKLNAKMFAEAKRLRPKFILGGECGHMWRVINQYMDTMNGPAEFGDPVPTSPITGTRFEHAKSTKMIHVCEFTSDLIHHGKVKFDPSRNDHLKVTFHDSCNPARAMGMFEEPRAIIKATCNHFHEMPENTIREHTFCCGSGSGINAEENMEMRMRGGLPRAMAVKHVKEQHGVNMLSCICAVDRATLPPLMRYWVPGVDVTGVHELVGNALIMKGEKARETDLRGNPLPEKAEEVVANV